MPRWLVPCALLLLAGCGAGPPMTYLRLAPVSGPTIEVRGRAPIAVALVQIPASLDRLPLVTETGASTLALDQNATWAAPLDGMMTGVLAQNLQSRLPANTVLMPGEVAPSNNVVTVHVNVIRFLPIASAGGAHVLLDADWQVLTSPGRLLHSGQANIQEPSQSGAAAEAEAMSTALGELSNRIATGLAAR